MGSIEVIYERKLLIHMEFVEVSTFQKSWKALGCTEEDLRQLQLELLEDPEAGDVIPGAGSARKLRFGREGRGKRGDLRVIYVRFPAYESISLILAYPKNEQDNLTEADKRTIKGLIDEIEAVLPLHARTKSRAAIQKILDSSTKSSVPKKSKLKKAPPPKDKVSKKESKTAAKSKAKAPTKAKPKAKKTEKKR